MKYCFKYVCMNGDGVTAYVKAEHEQAIKCPKCGSIMSPASVTTKHYFHKEGNESQC